MKLFKISDFKQYSDFYIESGSCMGESIKRALQGEFQNIQSVEIHEPYYDFCMDQYGTNEKVTLYLGDTVQVLPMMLEKTGDQKAVIFLDAHPAGSGTATHDDLIKNGKKSEFLQDTILKKELAMILAHRNDHVILIDDQNGANGENKKYIKMIKKVNPGYKFYFIDEQLENGILHKEKILICLT